MLELIRQLQEEVQALRQVVAAQAARIEELTAQLARNSSNSSKPPSTNAPWLNVKRPPPRTPSGKKRGGQPGHPGHKRERQAADEEFDVHASVCEHCGAALDETSAIAGQDWVHQLVELVAAGEVRNYHYHVHKCRCGKRTRAPMPASVLPTATGPKLQAAITLLIAKYHLSREDVHSALEEIFGVKLSVGAVHAVTDRIGQATSIAAADVGVRLQAAPTKHCDETGWRHGGERAWLWIVTNAMGAFFRIDPRRNREALERLLPTLEGVIHTDRWRVYDIIEKHLRQLCHAHLRRDIQALIDLGPKTKGLGEALLAASNELFHQWHRFVNGELNRAGLQAAMAPVQAQWRELARQAATHEHKKARNLGRDLEKHWVSLWTFLTHEATDPTNNRAERGVRPGVLIRKSNGGTSSEWGAEFVANLQTVIATAKCQNVRLLDWLQRVFEAWWQPVPLPLLMPRTSG